MQRASGKKLNNNIQTIQTNGFVVQTKDGVTTTYKGKDLINNSDGTVTLDGTIVTANDSRIIKRTEAKALQSQINSLPGSRVTQRLFQDASINGAQQTVVISRDLTASQEMTSKGVIFGSSQTMTFNK